MINGDPNAFIDKAYSAQEIFYKFKEEEYMLQGYTADGQFHIEIQRHLPFLFFFSLSLYGQILVS